MFYSTECIRYNCELDINIDNDNKTDNLYFTDIINRPPEFNLKAPPKIPDLFVNDNSIFYNNLIKCTHKFNYFKKYQRKDALNKLNSNTITKILTKTESNYPKNIDHNVITNPSHFNNNNNYNNNGTIYLYLTFIVLLVFLLFSLYFSYIKKRNKKREDGDKINKSNKQRQTSPLTNNQKSLKKSHNNDNNINKRNQSRSSLSNKNSAFLKPLLNCDNTNNNNNQAQLNSTTSCSSSLSPLPSSSSLSTQTNNPQSYHYQTYYSLSNSSDKNSLTLNQFKKVVKTTPPIVQLIPDNINNQSIYQAIQLVAVDQNGTLQNVCIYPHIGPINEQVSLMSNYSTVLPLTTTLDHQQRHQGDQDQELYCDLIDDTIVLNKNDTNDYHFTIKMAS
jgi:preprotein translocase subunit SecG